uniref:Uncharacterized protein n=1 Tax=Cacopsylla melanoneura TaxID=428564 RepID=A0A8D8ZCH6_9HEMI
MENRLNKNLTLLFCRAGIFNTFKRLKSCIKKPRVKQVKCLSKNLSNQIRLLKINKKIKKTGKKKFEQNHDLDSRRTEAKVRRNFLRPKLRQLSNLVFLDSDWSSRKSYDWVPLDRVVGGLTKEKVRENFLVLTFTRKN